MILHAEEEGLDNHAHTTIQLIRYYRLRLANLPPAWLDGSGGRKEPTDLLLPTFTSLALITPTCPYRLSVPFFFFPSTSVYSLFTSCLCLWYGKRFFPPSFPQPHTTIRHTTLYHFYLPTTCIPMWKKEVTIPTSLEGKEGGTLLPWWWNILPLPFLCSVIGEVTGREHTFFPATIVPTMPIPSATGYLILPVPLKPLPYYLPDWKEGFPLDPTQTGLEPSLLNLLCHLPYYMP